MQLYTDLQIAKFALYIFYIYRMPTIGLPCQDIQVNLQPISFLKGPAVAMLVYAVTSRMSAHILLLILPGNKKEKHPNMVSSASWNKPMDNSVNQYCILPMYMFLDIVSVPFEGSRT